MVAAHEADRIVAIRRVVVRHPEGLHLRICSLVAQQAAEFDGEIYVCRGTIQADAKSVIHLLTLAAEAEVELTLKASGPGAEEALEAVAVLF